MLIGTRIGDERCTLAREFRTERRAFVTREPQSSRRHFRIRPAEHFKRQVGDNLRQWHWRIRDERSRTVAAALFAAETDEVDSTSPPLATREHACEFQHRDATGSIVVSAVEDLVIFQRFVNAEVVQVSTQHDRLARLCTSQHPDRVPGGALLARWDDARVERNALDITLVAVSVGVATGFESKLAKLRANIFGRNAFVDRAAAATLHRVAREKAKLRANVLFLDWPLALCGVGAGD